MLLALILLPFSITQQTEDPYAFLDLDYYAIFVEAYEAYIEEDYDLAIEKYLTYLAGNARDAKAIYNLACCYGLIGDEMLATSFMLRSVRAGFEDIDWISWDPDFDSVRDGEFFTPALDSISMAMAEEEANLGSIIHIPGITMIPCRIKLPDGFDPDVPHDLIIGLHGYGSNPDKFIKLSWDGFEEPDFIYAVPQAPYPRFAGAEPGFSWMIWSDDEDLPVATVEGSHQYICDVTKTLQEDYLIDETYLMGFSQGCGFTFETGLLNPELFDGLICFAGWLDTTVVSVDDIEAAGDLRIFIAHGTEDAVVEYEASTTAFQYLTSFGMDVEFHDFPSGHTVDPETLREAQVWMGE